MKKVNRRNFIQDSAILGFSTLLLGANTSRILSRTRGFDILIRNASVIDGSGSKEYISDIGIQDGKIIRIGNLSDAEAIRVIDARGLKVSPGFIDIHSHTDLDLILNPKAESKIRQGVTTEVCGQDGESAGPVGGPDVEKIRSRFKEEYGIELPWMSLGGFLDDFSKRKFSVNIASMIGLGTIREIVVGLDDRPATADEMKKMQAEVRKAIEEGAIGISTGLEYTPGSFASTAELIEMCKAAPEEYKLYSTHMRNEDNTVIEAVEEAIEISRRSGSRLLISHLKVSGKSNWQKADRVLELMDKAIEEGLEVHADRYTYVAYHTGLANFFPLWSRDGGTDKFLENLKNPSNKNQLKEYSETKVKNLDGDWNGILISSVGRDEFKHYQGKTIKEIAEESGMDYYDAAVKVILDSENRVMIMGFGMEEMSTEKIIAHPRIMISSDAGAHAPYPPMNKSIAHPRAYGTFPRAIAKYVRERKICTLEEMVRKMTSMPADKLRLKDIGRLQEQKNADLVLFDFEKITDKATFTDTQQYPDGIPYVIVNGEVVIDTGEHTGKMPGKVIRGSH